MDATRASAASGILLRHWRDGLVLEALPTSLRPSTRAEGYAIQAQLEASSRHGLWGWKIAAFRGIAADLRQRDPDLVSVGLYASDPDLSRPVAEYPPVASSPVGAGDWFVMADFASARGGADLADALAALPLARPALGIGAFALRSSVAAHDLP